MTSPVRSTAVCSSTIPWLRNTYPCLSKPPKPRRSAAWVVTARCRHTCPADSFCTLVDGPSTSPLLLVPHDEYHPVARCNATGLFVAVGFPFRNRNPTLNIGLSSSTLLPRNLWLHKSQSPNFCCCKFILYSADLSSLTIIRRVSKTRSGKRKLHPAIKWNSNPLLLNSLPQAPPSDQIPHEKKSPLDTQLSCSITESGS